MSWIPPSSAGVWDPQSRTAPRPAAAAPVFSFGHVGEEKPISQRPQRAEFDPSSLCWWEQPRNKATVSGTANSDVEAWWQQARQEPGAVAALVNADARKTNKAQGTGSCVAASLGDREQFDLSQAASCYKSDMTSGHVRVGKRGVAQSAVAMQAFEESRRQAEQNKAVGRGTNLKLSLL